MSKDISVTRDLKLNPNLYQHTDISNANSGAMTGTGNFWQTFDYGGALSGAADIIGAIKGNEDKTIVYQQAPTPQANDEKGGNTSWIIGGIVLLVVIVAGVIAFRSK